MAVLVTGGAGYIGSHTAVALHGAGRRVVLLDDLSNSSERAVAAVRDLVGSDVAFVRGDAADVDLVTHTITEHGIDEVVHFAAFKSVSQSVERPLAYFANNMGSLFGVVEAMASTGIHRLVFSSSCTVYGEPAEVPVTEVSPTGAANPYGWTKLHGEQFLGQVAANGGLDVMLLRYFNPVGAHPSGTMGEDPNGIPTNLVPFLMQVAVGRLERLSVFGGDYDTPDGSPVRDYLHVVDLADGHVAALDALDSNPGCTAVNLGTGRGHSVLEVVAAAEQVLGRRVPHEVVDRRPGDVARIWAATDLAERLLGWTATRDLSEMLADHWRWESGRGVNSGGFDSDGYPRWSMGGSTAE